MLIYLLTKKVTLAERIKERWGLHLEPEGRLLDRGDGKRRERGESIIEVVC